MKQPRASSVSPSPGILGFVVATSAAPSTRQSYPHQAPNISTIATAARPRIVPSQKDIAGFVYDRWMNDSGLLQRAEITATLAHRWLLYLPANVCIIARLPWAHGCLMKKTEGQFFYSDLNTREENRKARKYVKWHPNQIGDVPSPIFTKQMFWLAQLWSVMFEVLNMQLSWIGDENG